MCQKAKNPCPGCKNRDAGEARWMFLSTDERQALETSGSEASATEAKN